MQPDAPALTFAWPVRRWFNGKIVLFFFVSLLLHGICFLLFQVVNREKVTAPERERELQLLSSEIPEHRALLEAVEAEVPLGALSHHLLSVDYLLQQPYRSAFSNSKVEPKDPERWRSSATASIPILADLTRSTRPKKFSDFAGAIILSPPLDKRLKGSPELPTAPGGKVLENPEYLLGVNGTGTVQFVWLQKSSGDESADRIGEEVLRGLSFKGGEAHTQFAPGTLQWRNPRISTP